VDVVLLGAVVALTEATAVLLLCAAAMVARLVATHPEAADTVAATGVVAAAAVASTLTETRQERAKIDTTCEFWSHCLQKVRGKSRSRTKNLTAGKRRPRPTCVCSERGYETGSLLFPLLPFMRVL